MRRVSLPEILMLLDQPGRFLVYEPRKMKDATGNLYPVETYDLCSVERGQIEILLPDQEAQAAIDECGHCSDPCDNTSHGLAYGPYCSTYSLAKHIAFNEHAIISTTRR